MWGIHFFKKSFPPDENNLNARCTVRNIKSTVRNIKSTVRFPDPTIQRQMNVLLLASFLLVKFGLDISTTITAASDQNDGFSFFFLMF